MKLSNAQYDFMKWVVMVLLPGLGVLYAALGAIWGLPYVQQIVGTLAAVCTFLGTMLQISSANFRANGK